MGTYFPGHPACIRPLNNPFTACKGCCNPCEQPWQPGQRKACRRRTIAANLSSSADKT